MPYIIDGHNLIPKIPGLSLRDLDDEGALIQILGKFANQHRTKIEVFFDRAPAGQARSQVFGLVKAVFVRQGSSADHAIKTRLKKLAKQAKNWTVVSSDGDIRAEARSYQSRVLTAQEFARLIHDGVKQKPTIEDIDEKPDQPTPDVDYWLEQFSGE